MVELPDLSKVFQKRGHDGPCGLPLHPPDRPTLLLAYGIAEWESVVTHLVAMMDTGIAFNRYIYDRIADERSQLHLRFYEYWDNATPSNTPRPDPVEWARRYLADHQPELEALLAE